MAWQTIASGNSIEEFQGAQPSIEHLNAGDKGRIVIGGLPGTLAHVIFDIAGAEQTVGAYLAPSGVHVDDCYERDGIGYVEFTVEGTPVLPIIAAVVALVIGLGFLGILITIAMQIERIDISLFSWQVIIAIVVVVIAVAITTIFVARAAFK